MSTVTQRGLTIVFAGVFVLFVLACSSGQYGHLRRDAEARRIFDEHIVLPDHHYYYSGSDSKPRAIIAIHNDYQLQSELWKPVEATPEQLKTWLGNISPSLGRSINNYASVIVDPSGKTVGLWYSRFDRTTVQFKENNIVAVYPPLDQLEDPFRRFSDR